MGVAERLNRWQSNLSTRMIYVFSWGGVLWFPSDLSIDIICLVPGNLESLSGLLADTLSK